MGVNNMNCERHADTPSKAVDKDKAPIASCPLAALDLIHRHYRRRQHPSRMFFLDGGEVVKLYREILAGQHTIGELTVCIDAIETSCAGAYDYALLHAADTAVNHVRKREEGELL